MNENSPIIKAITHCVQHYNHEKYWKMREYTVSSKGSLIKKLYYLFQIKKMDAYNCASFGTHLGCGAEFKSVPQLPHGIRGIFISHNAKIGNNLRMYQQVTIGEGNGGAPVVGDDVFIGAGAKILGNIKIGNNVRIGANCVVVEDIPDNATVVMNKPRVIIRKAENSGKE